MTKDTTILTGHDVMEVPPVKRRPDLIDQFTELVVGSDEPRRLAERTVEVVMSLSNGRAGAVFAREGDRVNLFASRGIDQPVLDSVQDVWTRFRGDLEKGDTFYVPDRSTDRRLPKEEGEPMGPSRSWRSSSSPPCSTWTARSPISAPPTTWSG
jgi:hypothetical protein